MPSTDRTIAALEKLRLEIIKTVIAIIIMAALFIVVVFFQPIEQNVYPARVVDKLLISPTEIPYQVAGYSDDGEPLYTEKQTLTSHAFVIVKTGECATVPVDSAYFHRVKENDFVPVMEQSKKFTGKLEYRGIYYEHIPGDTLN